MFTINKENTILNGICVSMSILIVLVCYVVRLNQISFITPIQYVKIVSLSTFLFIAPDYIYNLLPQSNLWYRTQSFLAFGILLIFAMFGFLIPSYLNTISFAIIPISFFLILWELIRLIKNKDFFTFIIGIPLILLLLILFYSQGYSSFLQPEKIILGKAHIDMLFHSSISNMISTFGWSSTGLNGPVFFKYHWGSHAVIAYLKPWVGINTLMFYNVAYPAIFIPMFIKYFVLFIRDLNIRLHFNEFNIRFAIVFLTLLFSLPISAVKNAHPMISESLTISLIYSFLLLSILLSQYHSKQPVSIFKSSLFWFSIVILFIITITKISTGIALIIGIAYATFRVKPKIDTFITIAFGGFFISVLAYFLVFPVDRTTVTSTLFERIYSFWMMSDSFITYMFGVIVALFIILRHNRLNGKIDFLNYFKKKDFLLLETLFILNVGSVILSFTVTNCSSDVFYFCITQFFLAITIVICYTQKYFDKFTLNSNISKTIMISIVILSVASRPDLMKIKGGFLEFLLIKKEMKTLNPNQQTLLQLVTCLKNLDSQTNKQKTCIYIPQTENWYYYSQNKTYLGQFSGPMIVPALSGISLIGGISDSILTSTYNYYSYYFYKKQGLQSINLNEAKQHMHALGFTKMITFSGLNDSFHKY